MLADLVQVETEDGYRLHGAYIPATPTTGAAVDAVLFLHGDTVAYDFPVYLTLAQHLSLNGLAFLSANRRGHDVIARGSFTLPPIGHAFELVEDSLVDIAAWLELLRARGHRRIALGGHSGGAVRALYAQATHPVDDIAAVIAVSPAEETYAVLEEIYGDRFVSAYESSRAAVNDGRGDELTGPLPHLGSWYSHRALVETYAPDGGYSGADLASELDVPLLAVFATSEHPQCVPTRDRLTPSEDRTIEVIDGANHAYLGHAHELAQVIVAWVASLG